ncbi:MAG: hypothetical protein L0221_17960 [Chloroflexi bacterium]|nr:hypothetical protein [Chloroflexota bacterium]
MARTPKFICDSCGVFKLDPGAAFCDGCGRPTVWATYQDRTAWEVQQWRAKRAGSSAPASTIATLPAVKRPAPPSEDFDGFLRPGDPKPAAARPPGGPSPIAVWFRRTMRALRALFKSSTQIPLDPPNPVAQEAAPAEPPRRVTLVPAPEGETVPEGPAPPAALEAPPKPRKRPNPPTNKDMLKQALTVLNKVEQRLGQLEQEVAGIDDAVRKQPGGRTDDEQSAVGE